MVCRWESVSGRVPPQLVCETALAAVAKLRTPASTTNPSVFFDIHVPPTIGPTNWGAIVLPSGWAGNGNTEIERNAGGEVRKSLNQKTRSPRRTIPRISLNVI